MPSPLYLIDAFADRPFAGNPAGVCILDAPRDASWMQSLAMEMNQAETAFLVRAPDKGKDDFDLRWFTPMTEVDLCGHATLASAHALWETERVAASARIYFHTRSGVLTCTRTNGGLIQMDFPATPTTPTPDALDEDAIGSLGLSRRDVAGVYRTKFDVLVLVSDPAVLRALQPDFRGVAKVDARGVIVTSPSDDPRYTFLSRFFGPQSGIDEDPVTGSSHCALGPFWRERSGAATDDLTGYQASRRGGVVRVTVRGDRVLLGGRAVITLRGELLD